MGRAAGKHTPRGVERRTALDSFFNAGDDETPGDERQEGIGAERHIPGGRNHLANPPVLEQVVPVPEREYPFREAILAHGVPPDGAHWPRDPRLSGGQRGTPPSAKPSEFQPIPVPVYIVERTGGRRSTAIADTRRFTVPGYSSEPILVCSDSPSRSLVQMLNEDSTHNVRFGRLEDLTFDAQNNVITGGSRLPAGASGYTVLRTQAEIYAISETSSTAVISVILESELPGRAP
jgi:hypothetical protein